MNSSSTYEVYKLLSIMSDSVFEERDASLSSQLAGLHFSIVSLQIATVSEEQLSVCNAKQLKIIDLFNNSDVCFAPNMHPIVFSTVRCSFGS